MDEALAHERRSKSESLARINHGQREFVCREPCSVALHYQICVYQLCDHPSHHAYETGPHLLTATSFSVPSRSGSYHLPAFNLLPSISSRISVLASTVHQSLFPLPSKAKHPNTRDQSFVFLPPAYLCKLLSNMQAWPTSPRMQTKSTFRPSPYPLDSFRKRSPQSTDISIT